MACRAFAVIAGVGPGAGSAIAKRFAKSYPVVLLSRNATSYQPVVQEICSAGGSALGISTDLSDARSVTLAFERIASEFPNHMLVAAVFNSGGGSARKNFLELKEEDYCNGLKPAVSGFNFAQLALPRLLDAVGRSVNSPTLIFTGATASWRGSAKFAAIASGKSALRTMAQSIAREFGPQGLHISHVVVDGVIDSPSARGILDEVPDAKVSPDAIADTYWHLHTQPRSAFAFELEIRPYIEKW
ncbi:Short-chain dehydrogenase/reductase SDR [Penicillium waksmanii]|uniref:Short-chain dehydrogenase/reductase SDR n=1 Tax=Penicillium waksmanii TaxID=69791 RepID=UPI0025475E83|nr:Short-chain dehydrogenase/reductase SDR [Penicillium waksmanii]KAJ5979885.1 Short-chain dehydrogenase/reductase SDR [Penicillium waksmanii]